MQRTVTFIANQFHSGKFQQNVRRATKKNRYHPQLSRAGACGRVLRRRAKDCHCHRGRHAAVAVILSSLAVLPESPGKPKPEDYGFTEASKP